MLVHVGMYLAFSHGHTRAIPESLFCFCRLVIVMSAWAEWRTQLISVFCQTLQQKALDRAMEGIMGWDAPTLWKWSDF